MKKVCNFCGCFFNAKVSKRKYCSHKCYVEKRKKDYMVFKNQNPYKKRIMKIFQKMKERCYNQRDISYKNYGARGIKICKEWLNDYNKFYEWSINNGYKNNLSIDRIDTNKNYCPQNCRWATRLEQARNKRNSAFFEYNGIRWCLSEWADYLGITEKLLWQKIHRDGKTLKEIIEK